MRTETGNLMIEYSMAIALSAILLVLCEKIVTTQLKISNKITNKELITERMLILHNILKNELKCDNKQTQLTIHKKDSGTHESIMVLCKNKKDPRHEKKLYLQGEKACKLYLQSDGKIAKSLLNGICDWKLNLSKSNHRLTAYPKICSYAAKNCLTTKMIFTI